MKLKTLALAGAAAITLAATPASAAELLYSFSSLSGTDDFSFTLDSNPTPDFSSPSGGFGFLGYPVTTNAGPETAGSLTFFADGLSGGLGLQTPSVFYGFTGPQLFTGPFDTPTMLTGSFALNNTSSQNPIRLGSLTVSEVNAAVPEPGTWVMMLMGFGAMGWSFKRRRKLALA